MEKPNLRPQRGKKGLHGATHRNEFVDVEANQQEIIRYVRYRYHKKTKTHVQVREAIPDAFGLLPDKSYSVKKDNRWAVVAEIKDKAQYFLDAFAEDENAVPPDETVIVLLENTALHLPTSAVPFIRVTDSTTVHFAFTDDDDEEEEEEEEEVEYVMKKTRKGRDVEKKQTKDERRGRAKEKEVTHKGEVLVYFLKGTKKGKKQVIGYSDAREGYVRSKKKKSLLNNALA
ncbi:PDZ domain-containing protein [Balamuthia mandrillaris]